MKKFMKNQIVRYWPLLAFIVLTIPAILPLLKAGFFTMHDDQQVVRLFELDRALAAGQFPARWVGNLGFGYGYPLFIFYPPFVYYLGEIFHLLFGTTFIDTVKLVFVFAFIGAAVAMYLWSREHFGTIAAIIASAFYSYAPYHAVDAYVRGALAELTAFVWLPLVLWSTDRLILKQNRRHGALLALWLALLMLTHNLIFLPFFPLFIMYGLFLSVRTQHKLFALRSTLYAVLLAFGLSAFFWLPALVERKYTLVDSILLSELASYKLHFVYPTQLWNSLWGYGGSTEGPLDGLSLKIGKLHIILSALAVVLWTVIFLLKGKIDSQKKLLHCYIAALLFLLSAMMTTRYSQPIWEFLTPLQYLQFPWRFLTFTALFSSFLAGGVIAALGFLKSHLVSIVTATFTLALLLYPNFKLFQPQTYLDINDSYYINDEFLKWKISKTSFEFLPKGVKTTTEYNEIEKKEITQVDINRDQIATSPYRIISGTPSIGIKRNVPGEMILSVTNPPGIVLTTLELSIVDFPGWEVYIDGKKVDHTSENNLRLITVGVPSGEFTIRARLTNTLTRNLANWFTLGSLIVFVYQMRRMINKPLSRGMNSQGVLQ